MINQTARARTSALLLLFHMRGFPFFAAAAAAVVLLPLLFHPYTLTHTHTLTQTHTYYIIELAFGRKGILHTVRALFVVVYHTSAVLADPGGEGGARIQYYTHAYRLLLLQSAEDDSILYICTDAHRCRIKHRAFNPPHAIRPQREL